MSANGKLATENIKVTKEWVWKAQAFLVPVVGFVATSLFSPGG
jgi:hypothetical protein